MGVRVKTRALVAVLVSLVLLAGCAGPSKGIGIPTPTPSTSPRPYLTTTPTMELSDRTTKPGTKLKFGEFATVPYYSTFDKGLVEMTVNVDSAPAQDADIDKLRLSAADKDKLRGKTFFFVHVKMVNVDGVNLSEIVAPTMWAYTGGDWMAGTFLGLDHPQVPGCADWDIAPPEFAKPGAVYEQCELFFATQANPVTAVWYAEKPYENKKTRAVIWQR